jgi:hypothetical protein
MLDAGCDEHVILPKQDAQSFLSYEGASKTVRA